MKTLEKYVCFSNEVIDFRLDPLQLLDSDVQFQSFILVDHIQSTILIS